MSRNLYRLYWRAWRRVHWPLCRCDWRHSPNSGIDTAQVEGYIRDGRRPFRMKRYTRLRWWWVSHRRRFRVHWWHG